MIRHLSTIIIATFLTLCLGVPFSVLAQSPVVINDQTFQPWSLAFPGVAWYTDRGISYDYITISNAEVHRTITVPSQAVYCLALEMRCPGCTVPNDSVRVTFDNQGPSGTSGQQYDYYDLVRYFESPLLQREVTDCFVLQSGTYVVYLYAQELTYFYSFVLTGSGSSGYALVTPVPVKIVSDEITTTDTLLAGIRDYAHASLLWIVGTSVAIIGILSLLYLRVRV